MDYSPWGRRELDMTEHTHIICSTLYENIYSLFFSRSLNLKVTIRIKQDSSSIGCECGKHSGSWGLSDQEHVPALERMKETDFL